MAFRPIFSPKSRQNRVIKHRKGSKRTHPCGFLNSTHARLPHQTQLLVIVWRSLNIYSKYTTFPIPNRGVNPKSVRVNSSLTNVFTQQFHILLRFLSLSFSSSGEIKKDKPALTLTVEAKRAGSAVPCRSDQHLGHFCAHEPTTWITGVWIQTKAICPPPRVQTQPKRVSRWLRGLI